MDLIEIGFTSDPQINHSFTSSQRLHENARSSERVRSVHPAMGGDRGFVRSDVVSVSTRDVVDAT